MTGVPPPRPSIWFRLKRFLRRIPALERRWISDEDERDHHEGVVRGRLRSDGGAPPPGGDPPDR